MRQAKQSRTDDLTARAERMATERSDRIAHDLNQKTNQGTTRALEANRAMLKESAMASSVLGRQGRAVDQEVVTPKYPAQNAPVRRQDPQNFKKSTEVKKHRVQPDANLRGQDSLPPGYRRVMYRDAYEKKNDKQPRFHPQNGARPSPNRPQQRVQTNHGAPTRAARTRVAAHGITQNPVEEARRRKKLEARIRELGSK